MSSTYEKKRLENIKRNEEILAKLGVHQAKQDFGRVTKKGVTEKKKSLSKKRKSQEKSPDKAPRSSRRLKGEGPELNVYHSAAPRESVLTNQPSITPRTIKNGELVLGDTLANYTTPSANRELLQILRSLTKSKDLKNVEEDEGWITEEHESNGDVSGLTLLDNMVVKVVPERIYCMDFHPSERALIVVGDKAGNLGFFDADKAGEDNSVVVYEPHVKPVSDLIWNSTDKLFTCSYEGKVRCMDVQKALFHDIWSSSKFLTALEMGEDRNSMYIADGEGNLHQLDIRSNKNILTSDLHEKRIYMIHRNPHKGTELVSCSGDQTIAIWDIRKMKKNPTPVHSYKHDLAVTSARFNSISGTKIVSVSNDNWIRIWANVDKIGIKDENLKKIRHRNLTGRWVSNLEARWHPNSDDVFMIGSMDRAVDVFSSTGRRIVALVDEKLTSIPALNVFHSSRNIIASGNASGKVFVWK
jgi:WD40 repeat protein